MLVLTAGAFAQTPGARPWFVGLDGGVYRPDGAGYHRMGLAVVSDLAVSGNTPFVVGTDNQIWTTTSDNGWHPIVPGIKAQHITCAANGALFIIGTDSGVYTIQGSGVRRVGLGLARDLAVGTGNVYVVGADGHIWYSPNADGNWRVFNPLALAQRVAVSTEGGRDHVFILGTDNGVYRLTTDRFERLGLGIGTEISVSPEGEPYVIGGGHAVWRYHHDQWSQFGNGLAARIAWPR